MGIIIIIKKCHRIKSSFIMVAYPVTMMKVGSRKTICCNTVKVIKRCGIEKRQSSPQIRRRGNFQLLNR